MTKDPYRYFRVEARELLEGLTQGVLELDRGSAAPDLIARLLRFAHTLKGAARVVKQREIAERAHAIEDILSAHRESGQPLQQAQTSECLRLLDDVALRVKELEPVTDDQPMVAVRDAAGQPLETLRVDVAEMDSLLRAVTEASVQVETVRAGIATVMNHRDVANELLDPLAAGIREIQDVAHRLRLTPVRTAFPSLERAVRDAANALGKHVEFQSTGGDVRLDISVLAPVRDALMHVVRNAVTHGIEVDTARRAAGKPPKGRIHLHVERRGSSVAFVCTDDGHGVDIEAVRKAAVARGLVTAAAAPLLSRDRVIAMLLSGGLSTSTSVTELSGRGIGLDVARETTARLKGVLSLHSEPGQGATVEMVVPVSIVSMQALVVEAAGTLAAIPIDAIRETLRIRDADVARTANGDSILHGENAIPFVQLVHILDPGATARGTRVWSAIILRAGLRSVAVGVDRLHGTSHVVMRPLPDLVAADPSIAGASLDAQGNPQLVLDPAGLVAAAEQSRGASTGETVTPRAPVLVIDDSLTTRMLEQSILESAGYEVDIAVSAEDALIKARVRRYGLFIVDVEMPGMSGFEFVAETRADAALRDTPAILVTSRNAPEDRWRGQQVGASAYIVKSEFNQEILLATIRTLVS